MTFETVSVSDALAAIEAQPPLVVSYTNSVTVSSVADTTLYWGGLPVMSEDIREAADLMAMASACLINMGTVDETGEERMITGGRAAVKNGAPVVFDPVGAGATAMRTRVAERIIDEVDVSIVKGNYGEITALTGNEAEVRGVESVGEYAEIAETAMACARKSDAVVVASGEADIIATSEVAYELESGDPMMGRFVGSGCLLGVTLATFAGGLGTDRALDAAVAGTAGFGLVGERTAEQNTWNGPATYQHAFLDSIANLDRDQAASMDLDERLSLVAEA